MQLKATGLGILLCCMTACAHSALPRPERPVCTNMLTEQQVASVLDRRARVTSAEILEIESRLKGQPTRDARPRTELLIYYGLNMIPESEAKRQELLFWMVELCPENPALSMLGDLEPLSHNAYNTLMEMWRTRVSEQPRNPRILVNAGAFMTLNDPSTAVTLFERAEKLQTPSFRTSRLLALAYTQVRHESNESERNAVARKELAAYERALAIAPRDVFFVDAMLGAMEAAMSASANEKAKNYANRLLATADTYKNSFHYGNIIHKAHLTLGRLALGENDIVLAQRQLLEAGKTPGSPQLDTFGPNMALAREMLRAGDADTVVQFLELCKRFWKDDKLTVWIEQVRQGVEPDFGPNIVY